MANFAFDVTLNENLHYNTARVADDSVGAQPLNDSDVGKFLKLKFSSQYGLCAVGDEIEGILETGPDNALHNGFPLATVRKNGRVKVMLDGLQGTPGTGVIAVGDYVVAGTVTARGTVLPAQPKVCKATAAATGLVALWRVVHLYGTTAVGQTALIERV